MTPLLIDPGVLLGSEAAQEVFLMSSLRKAVLSLAVRRMDRMDVAYPVPAGLSATDFISARERIILIPADVSCVFQALGFLQLS